MKKDPEIEEFDFTGGAPMPKGVKRKFDGVDAVPESAGVMLPHKGF